MKYQPFAKSACEDIWCFMYSFGKNLCALGLRNVEPSI